MTRTPAEVLATHHDVVIVGAGSAGCVLAARLSEAPDRSVLLLEAGPVFADLAGYPAVLSDERTFPQEHLWRYDGFHGEGDVLPAAIVRGRVMGGSGAVNGMIWQRGLPEDYDGWGLPDWTAAALGPVFDRLEDDRDRLPVPGGGGPAGGSAPSTPTPNPVPLRRLGREHWPPSHVAFHDALRDLGAPENPDLLRAEHQGVGSYVRNSDDGRRMGAALTHLLPALHRPNLTVLGDVQVARVVVDGSRATGLDVRVGGCEVRTSAAEVVLSAGAVESPQLLTHSGIGPADALRALGIVPVVDLPGVGAGLTDHPSVVTTVRLRDEIRAWDLRCTVGLVHTSARAAAAGRRSDLQLLVMSGPYVGNNGGHLPHAADPTTVDAVISPILYAPESVGRIEVVSTDPGVRPRIHYDYLRSAADRERLREAVRLTARAYEHPAFADLIADATGAPDAATLADDALLDAWIRPALQSTLHGCGTCRMGPDDDPAAVVDERCRVRGVDGLRVVDLSVVPRAPTAPTNATAMAVAERVAGWMREA